MDSYSERFIVCYLTQWKTNQPKNRSIDQSFIHCTIHIMDSSCCLERDRWQSASHSKGTEILFIIDYNPLLRVRSDWKFKIKGLWKIQQCSRVCGEVFLTNKLKPCIYICMRILFYTLSAWQTIKRLPVLWLIKMWETINTGHHLPMCALISHQTQRSRSQSPYVGRGEPD